MLVKIICYAMSVDTAIRVAMNTNDTLTMFIVFKGQSPHS